MTSDTHAMEPAELRAVLLRGGLDAAALEADDARPASTLRYNALQDPAGGERLGRQLAAAVDTDDVDTVLIWQEATDVALGFVVARELSVPAVRCFDNDGLIAYEGVFGSGVGVLIVADLLRDAESVRAMLLLAEQQAKSVVAATVLVETASPGMAELLDRGVDLRSLLSAVEPA